MDIDKLIERGYKEFTPSSYRQAKRACQKRINNSNGDILYFITVYLFHYEYDKQDRYEAHIQLYQKDTHNPLDLNFFGGWTIENVEKYADFIYYMGVNEQFEPYEVKYNEED